VCDTTSASYRPPKPMARFVQLRDRTCQFPGCRRRAITAEIDHLTPWAAGGPTTPMNLICLCARHHHLKHDGH
uniref:HNH endonuclease signature motif containing protein n=1 Tax=uncultured Jatrophihabitans sp. TaxID=1610747 RepID=UPI0035CBA675